MNGYLTAMKKTKGLLIQTFAYAVAILAAILVARQFPDLHLLWQIAIGDVVGTLIIFVFSLLMNNSSMYDPYWSVKPMVIAGVYFWLMPDPASLRAWLAGGLMMLYGIRLTSNFLRDWPGLQHEDWRYVNFRDQYPKTYWLISLSGIHFFPSVLVYLACLPAYYAMMEPGPGLLASDIAGGVIFLGSILLSFIADEQMRNFRKNPENKGKIMDLGLWKFSRHPNYLGEVLGWWGLWCFALSVSSDHTWTGAGALAITLLFYFISIPLMDKRSLERRPGFKEYMDQTPRLFPVFRRKKEKES